MREAALLFRRARLSGPRRTFSDWRACGGRPDPSWGRRGDSRYFPAGELQCRSTFLGERDGPLSTNARFWDHVAGVAVRRNRARCFSSFRYSSICRLGEVIFERRWWFSLAARSPSGLPFEVDHERSRGLPADRGRSQNSCRCILVDKLLDRERAAG